MRGIKILKDEYRTILPNPIRLFSRFAFREKICHQNGAPEVADLLMRLIYPKLKALWSVFGFAILTLLNKIVWLKSVPGHSISPTERPPGRDPGADSVGESWKGLRTPPRTVPPSWILVWGHERPAAGAILLSFRFS